MNISSTLMLCLGLSFAFIYFLIFTVGFIITMRQRKAEIKKRTTKKEV